MVKKRGKVILTLAAIFLVAASTYYLTYKHNMNPLNNPPSKIEKIIILINEKDATESMGKEKLNYTLAVSSISYILPFASNLKYTVEEGTLLINSSKDINISKANETTPIIYLIGPIGGAKQTGIILREHSVVVEGETYTKLFSATDLLNYFLLKNLKPKIVYSTKHQSYALYFQHPLSGKIIPAPWYSNKPLQELMNTVSLEHENGTPASANEVRALILGEK